MIEKAARFPEIDWFCDNCGTLLNRQANFDDHHYIWRCTKCGYKNSISRNNIMWQAKFTKPIGSFLGWIRSLLVYVFIALIIRLITNRIFPFTGILVNY